MWRKGERGGESVQSCVTNDNRGKFPGKIDSVTGVSDGGFRKGGDNDQRRQKGGPNRRARELT